MTYAMGWVRDDQAVEAIQLQQKYPLFVSCPANMILEEDLPEAVHIWGVYRKLGIPYPSKNQGGVGSCVSFGTNTGVRARMVCEILRGDPEEFKDIVEEVTYGGSRVEVGGGKIGGDGSVGAWAAEFVKRWGVLARGVYGSHDLSRYDESTCRKFGKSGVPDELEPLAKEHPVSEITLCQTWPEVKKALATGCGIAVCSNRGFSMKRDSNGICKPEGSWAHCMAIIGYDKILGNEYGFIDNSWGTDAHTGPVGPGDPPKSGFYAAAEVIERDMLSQKRGSEAWAFAGLKGFQSEQIDWASIWN